ncbi:MAG: glycoside hydrolase family 57 protein [Bacteroidaceae bacterium]|nr:glycoside hydrolase family 57 protein [Bacteroidaceae bacterium]
MKRICLYFEIHQIIHLKRYRFFDIGRDHYYYDDYENERSINDIAERSYVPALQTLIQMCKDHPEFKVAFSLSGCGLEQLEFHAPQVIDLLREINSTGQVEFLCEPYSHGLASLANEESFAEEVKRMSDTIKNLFGKRPKVFRNSSLIYNDDIGAQVAAMGFKGILTEGAKQVLGWKSPHYIYNCASDPRLKLLLRDIKLSEDITERFSRQDWSEFPLFADKWVDWIANTPEGEDVINIFGELVTFGILQPLSSNILEFLKAIPALAKERGIGFALPSELCEEKSVGAIEVPYNISWVDEERDTSCWLGNVMQREAFNKLYSIADRVRVCGDRRIQKDWDSLQASNNFRFMTTKPGYQYRGIYDSPYDAFTNYMNILGDFISRVNNLYGGADNEEIDGLITMIKNQGDELAAKDKEIERLRKKLEKYNPTELEEKKPAKKPAAKKPAAKKAAPKKEAPAPKAAPKAAEVKKEPAKKAAPKKK